VRRRRSILYGSRLFARCALKAGLRVFGNEEAVAQWPGEGGLLPPLPLVGGEGGLGKAFVPPLPRASEATGPAVGASFVLVAGES